MGAQFPPLVLGSGVQSALGNALNAAGGVVGFSGSLGVSGGTSLALGGATIGANALAVTGTSLLSGKTTVSGGSLGLSGNISQAAWTTAGIRYANVASTLTDTTSSGTVAQAYTDLFGGNTIAASSATTFTNYATAKFSAPTAGTNVTFTNKSAIAADSIAIGGATQGANAFAVTGTSSMGTINGVTIPTATDTAALLGTAQLWIANQTFGANTNLNGPVHLGAANYLDWAGRTALLSPANGTLNIQNSAGSISTFLSIPVSATLHLGAADAASPVAQTLGVQGVVAGTTNTAGTNFTITGSQSTGPAAGGSIILQTAPGDTTHATTAASGTGTTATITFSGTNVYTVGGTITVAGVTPAGYNGVGQTVTASSAGSVSFTNATTGAQTVAGTVIGASTQNALVTALTISGAGQILSPNGYAIGGATAALGQGIAPSGSATSVIGTTVKLSDNGGNVYLSAILSAITFNSAAAINFGSSGIATPDAGLSRISAGVVGVGTGAQGSVAGSLQAKNITANGVIVLANFTVAGLPSASTSGAGATAFVTDSTLGLSAGLGLTVVGGGANKVPVYSDGTNWIIG